MRDIVLDIRSITTWEPTTLNMIFSVLGYDILMVLLDTNCNPWCSVTTPNANWRLFVIPCKFWGIIDLQCCNYCHLPRDFSSNFHSSMTTFHRTLPTREDTVYFLAAKCFHSYEEKKGRRNGEGQMWRKFPKNPFLLYWRKINTFIFGGMVTSLGPCTIYTWSGAQRL